jgi:hypothetical protein
METSTEIRALPPVVRQALVLPAEPASPVEIDVAIEDGVARGHLGWAASCRLVVLVDERSQKVVRSKPAYTAGAVAAGTGVGAGIAGGALLERRNKYSNDVTCEENDDGTQDCSSPRGVAIGLGLTLVGSAIALTTVGIVTAASRSSNRLGDVDMGPTRQVRVLAEGVPCGDGPVAWLGVALYRADERVAASTTDGDDNVAFKVPAWLTGLVTLVADSRSSRYGLIAPGQRLGEIVLEPRASPSTW